MFVCDVCSKFRDAIVSWLQEKVKIGVHNITTMEEAVHVFNSESMLVLGVVDSLEVFSNALNSKYSLFNQFSQFCSGF